MNEKLIENWNKVVKSKDDVYHLGDFGWFHTTSDTEKLASRLNGRIHLIIGNHDRESVTNASCFFWMGNSRKRLNIHNQIIIIDHYAMLVWDKSHYGSWMLFGHSHGKLNGWINIHLPLNKMLDVGVDSHNYTPWHYDEVKKYMDSKSGETVGQYDIGDE
jgi:calcineurin-like phosphoesterase family protein